MSRITVMVADDHYIVRMGLRTILELEPLISVVAEAADGAQAVQMYREHQPDVVLMDVRMPAVDGVEAIRRICAESPGARIVAMSNYEGDQDIHRAIEAGARTYLLKRTLGDEVIATVKAVHAGQRPMSADVKRVLAGRMPGGDLTARELEVLHLVVEGLTNKEIAGRLNVGVSTVNTHVLNILSKLGVQDRTQAVTAAIVRGIVHLSS